MKKVLTLLVALVAAVSLVACTTNFTADDAHDYYVTGQFAGWGDATAKPEFKMEAVASDADERVASIKADLKKAVHVYIIELTFAVDASVDWTVDYTINGEAKSLNGNLAVKFLQTNAGEEAPNWWGQNKESGEFKSLTPSTIYFPPYRETDTAGDLGGTWADNPVMLAEGTYYIVYVQYSATSHAVAAIKK
ncbi:hypothetical protein LJC17_02605 [Acholeplasma sp. OttesenSCG-928-E16]|nr:hypothetical protein [Acholeplasma sp. OttesenSCG-928-E16]